jgi:hypothetical protein
MEEHVFDFKLGKITVTPATVKIEHKKGTYHGGKVKEIRIKSITGIETREPGAIMAGYISFMFSGGKEAGGYGRFEAAKNENTVMVKKDFKQVLECKALVERYMYETNSAPAQVATTSDADELAKWVALRDSGAITAEEYEAKKRQILGL